MTHFEWAYGTLKVDGVECVFKIDFKFIPTHPRLRSIPSSMINGVYLNWLANDSNRVRPTVFID